ncbi:MAG TPA: thiamine pyrophosphate-binding protein [Edaphobacter sp.]|nr:thiamine pyrophosphate-binding protein [Edaphobacter sp.]
MPHASDVLGERLIIWGVDTIFRLPGDGVNGVFEALRTHKEKICFIHVRHEEAAALMACAYAKFAGRLRRMHLYIWAWRNSPFKRTL